MGGLFGNLVSKSESCGVQNKTKTNKEQTKNKAEQNKIKSEQSETKRNEKEKEGECEKEREVERENDSSPLKVHFRSDGDELQIQVFTCFFSL